MCAIGSQFPRTTAFVVSICWRRSSATFGPSPYPRWRKAWMRQEGSVPHCSIFWSLGWNVILLTPAGPAHVPTNDAMSLIFSSLSFVEKEGIPFPPFRTCRSTRAASGLSWSRLGPTVPLVAAAASAWQSPQPASFNAFAPAEPAALDPAASFLPAQYALMMTWRVGVGQAE